MARPIVLISHLFRLADTIKFRNDYSPPSSRHLDPTKVSGVRLVRDALTGLYWGLRCAKEGREVGMDFTVQWDTVAEVWP